MRERFQAAKEELDFDRSSFYLGIIVGCLLALILLTILPIVFGGVGGFFPDSSEKTVDINADIVVKDFRESDNRMLIQLVNETNAESVYVITESDKSNLTESHYLGSKGNPTAGSTVSVSVGVKGGDVYAQKGDTVKVIAVKKGQKKVIKKFSV